MAVCVQALKGMQGIEKRSAPVLGPVNAAAIERARLSGIRRPEGMKESRHAHQFARAE
jgi:hypothetical protein